MFVSWLMSGEPALCCCKEGTRGGDREFVKGAEKNNKQNKQTCQVKLRTEGLGSGIRRMIIGTIDVGL